MVALSTVVVHIPGADAIVVPHLAPQQVRARGALRRLDARHRCYGHQQVSGASELVVVLSIVTSLLFNALVAFIARMAS